MYCWRSDAGQNINYDWYKLDLNKPEAPASSGSILDIGGEEDSLHIIQGETTAVAFSPALFFGEGSSYLLRSNRHLVDGE